MLDPAVAAICPNDGSAVTLHLDPLDRDTDLGVNTGLAGDIYFGRCATCQQIITKVAGPVHTTVGGGPSVLNDLHARMNKGDRYAERPAAVDEEEAQRFHDEAAARRQAQADEEAAADEERKRSLENA